MMRTTKTFSVSLTLAVADAMERIAEKAGISVGLKIAEIVETHVINASDALDADVRADLKLLRDLREEAVSKMEHIRISQGFSADITLKTFQACQNDRNWLRDYETYIRGDAVSAGNPRKTNANQTIGSRIKSRLRAEDLTDMTGKAQRGRAPIGSIIQTYQLLRLP